MKRKMQLNVTSDHDSLAPIFEDESFTPAKKVKFVCYL